MQLRKRDELEPGEQEAGADEGLEHEAEIVELGLPAVAVIPLRVRLDRSRSGDLSGSASGWARSGLCRLTKVEAHITISHHRSIAAASVSR